MSSVNNPGTEMEGANGFECPSVLLSNFDMDDDAVFFFMLWMLFINCMWSSLSFTNQLWWDLLLKVESTGRCALFQTFFRLRKPRRPDEKRTRRVLRLILRGSCEQFKKNFRMTKAAFKAMCRLIKAEGLYSDRKRKRSGKFKRRVTVEVAFAMSLWFVAHAGRVLLVANSCGYSPQAVRKHVGIVVPCVTKTLFPKIVKMPTTPEEIAAIAQDFKNRCHFDEVLCAVDGTHIPIWCPEEAAGDYINRKGFRSLVFQGAAIGTTLQFIDWAGGWAGSVGDSMVFKNSQIFRDFVAGVYGNCIMLGDAAYGLQTWLMTPYERGLNLPENQSRFNFWQSSARMTVERAFGVLKKRFPILLSPFSYNVEWVCSVVTFCVTVHNVCCLIEEEWDANELNMWVESLEDPPGVDDFNFDNDEVVRNMNRVRPPAAAKIKRDDLAANLPPLPHFHREGF